MRGRAGKVPPIGCAFYRTLGQREPVREWLQGLGKEVSKTIGSDVLAVQWSWPVGKPLVDGLGGALYEIRSTHDRTEYRVFFCIAASKLVLLHGIVKKRRAAPAAEIGVARKRLREVVSR
jgi:phage-related protein